jgi:hypothetical protein
MPFIFLPLIWGQFSRDFERKVHSVERAHQDGLHINLHSPEAFEEAFYKAFWPTHYQDLQIPIWSVEANLEFDDFFRDHIKKLLIRDKKRGHLSRTRYISKNNLNITRVNYLAKLFPSATFLISFRQPLQQAMSLLRQHNNFTHLHSKDKFSKNYMAHIGHFDFGDNFKPVNFNDWLNQCKYRPDTLNFWLAYWNQCYGHLVSNQTNTCLFFNFDLLCQAPEESLTCLAEHLKLAPRGLLKSLSSINQVTPHEIEASLIDSALIIKANKLYSQLACLSINKI